jgi:hypothetical protein
VRVDYGLVEAWAVGRAGPYSRFAWEGMDVSLLLDFTWVSWAYR